MSVLHFLQLKYLLTAIVFMAFLKPVLADNAKKNSLTTSALLQSHLKLSAFRHKVLSNNLANINTPRYTADEVKLPKKEEDLIQLRSHKLKLAVTSVKHFKGNHKYDTDFPVEKLKDPDEIKMNGNNVSLSQQLTKLSENQVNYDVALQAYKSSNGLVSAVLGK